MSPPTVSSRPGDYATHRQQLLAHCLWMHGIAPDYALGAAGRYESDSQGALKGFSAEVRRAITNPQPKEQST
jgi:hypothetical protein